MTCPICDSDDRDELIAVAQPELRPFAHWCPCGCIFDGAQVLAIVDQPLSDQEVAVARAKIQAQRASITASR